MFWNNPCENMSQAEYSVTNDKKWLYTVWYSDIKLIRPRAQLRKRKKNLSEFKHKDNDNKNDRCKNYSKGIKRGKKQ